MNSEEQQEFNQFLEELIRGSYLEEAPLGITKKVISDGIDSLSEKQHYVFQKNVLDIYVTKKCSECGSNIPWSEMMLAYENDGSCGYCLHMRQRREIE